MKPRYRVRADGRVERVLPGYPIVAYFRDGERVPVEQQPVRVGDHWPERPTFLSRSDGAHLARLLELSPHMPGPPAA